jgi:hypothetical protein
MAYQYTFVSLAGNLGSLVANLATQQGKAYRFPRITNGNCSPADITASLPQ